MSELTEETVNILVEQLEVAGERMAYWFKELREYIAIRQDPELHRIFTGLGEAYVNINGRFYDIIDTIEGTLARARERNEQAKEQDD